MTGDASTLPLRETPQSGVRRRFARRLSRRGAGTLAGTDSGALGGAVAMLTIVILSLLVVLMAANRPSLLAPTTHTNYYPHWMAGPLGGLWPVRWAGRSACTPVRVVFARAVRRRACGKG